MLSFSWACLELESVLMLTYFSFIYLHFQAFVVYEILRYEQWFSKWLTMNVYLLMNMFV